jgi:hypothetical protein
MEFNNPSQIVKDLTFGQSANDKIMSGVEKLTNAVKSTLGASGKCVIYEDALGRPVITKDGVTVAESVVLIDPVENIGATLIKEAAANTVKEAGDGTTTATVLAHSILKQINDSKMKKRLETLKLALLNALKKLWFILIKPVYQLRIKCSAKLLVFLATMTFNLEKNWRSLRKSWQRWSRFNGRV